MTERKTVTVSGIMEVSWTVELPEEHKYNGQACEDPAVECALSAITQHCSILLWGEREPHARVYLDVGEDDVRVEDDDR